MDGIGLITEIFILIMTLYNDEFMCRVQKSSYAFDLCSIVTKETSKVLSCVV